MAKKAWGATNDWQDRIDEAYGGCEYKNWIASQMGWGCDSPIESLLGGAIRTIITAAETVEYEFYGNVISVLPQHRFERFRADLAVGMFPKNADPYYETPLGFVFCAIECDGHAFHQATKEQAARDKRRDRWFATNGIPLLRFTGSEIYADPFRCAYEVWDFMRSQDSRFVEWLKRR